MFGQVYLNHGRINGHQVVPAAWVDASFVPRVQSRRDRERLYGYGWWIRDLAGRRTYYVWGYGGQYIIVVPDLDLVIATTSSTSVSDDRRGHRRTVDEVIEQLIIAPIAASTREVRQHEQPPSLD